MAELSYLTKMATVFRQIERAVIGTIERAPGYISARNEKGLITLALDTAQLPHGAAAGPALARLTETLEKRFGAEVVKLEQPSQEIIDMDLGIPPAYRMTLRLPDTHTSLMELIKAHKDVAVGYCQTALKGDTDAQLEYLLSELGEGPGTAIFQRITGAPMEVSHTPRSNYANSPGRQRGISPKRQRFNVSV